LFAMTSAPGGIDRDGLFYGGGFTLLGYQIVGVLAVGAFTFVGSLIIWFVIKVTVGLRVQPDAEVSGLDLSEMGMEAYAPDSVA
ncbi:MAG: ammonium transporter, partial [SAR324 cluster bacterium]|nr:ammonium transporter [SAR324 cluster bacterium]